MIIPHDHHSIDSDTCQYPASQKSHHPAFPSHCHAFNGLASEKAINYIKLKPHHILEFIPGSTPDTMHSAVETYEIEVYNTIISDNSDIPEYQSLRAPPSLI